MSRQKKGEPGDERATQRLKQTLLKKYGSEEAVHKHFVEMGRKGGIRGGEKGFALDRERAKRAGTKGGEKSIRGHEFLKEENYMRWYRNKKTGRVVKYIYDFDKNKYVLDVKYMTETEVENEVWI